MTPDKSFLSLLQLDNLYLKPYNHLKWYKRKPTWWFQIFFMFTPIWGRFPNLTNIFQRCWNHQPETIWVAGMSFHDPWNSRFGQRFALSLGSDFCRCSWTQTTPSTPRCARNRCLKAPRNWHPITPWGGSFRKGCLGVYRGWNTTQLHRDYNKPWSGTVFNNQDSTESKASFEKKNKCSLRLGIPQQIKALSSDD